MFWWLKKLKKASQNNFNGKKKEKQPLKFGIDWKTLTTVFSFFIGTNVYKKHKISAI